MSKIERAIEDLVESIDRLFTGKSAAGTSRISNSERSRKAWASRTPAQRVIWIRNMAISREKNARKKKKKQA